MADTIKLQVLDTIEGVLEDITDLNEVNVNPPTPIRRDSLRTPIKSLFMFDEQETNTVRNRIERGTFPLHMEIWYEGKDYSRYLENLRGTIKSNLYDNEELRDAHISALEQSSEKFYVEGDDEEGGYGVITLIYNVMYEYAYGRPFTKTIT